MTVKVVVDMNLSPEWVPVLTERGHEAVHWSIVGSPEALDIEIMDWARSRKFIVFTHDLDFGTTLALTHALGPSVIQLRGQRVLPEQISTVVIAVTEKYEEELHAGALIVIDENRSRVRVLPL